MHAIGVVGGRRGLWSVIFLYPRKKEEEYARGLEDINNKVETIVVYKRLSCCNQNGV